MTSSYANCRCTRSGSVKESVVSSNPGNDYSTLDSGVPAKRDFTLDSTSASELSIITTAFNFHNFTTELTLVERVHTTSFLSRACELVQPALCKHRSRGDREVSNLLISGILTYPRDTFLSRGYTSEQ